MNTTVSFTRDGRTDSVSDTDSKGTTFQAVTHSKDGISSFARLRDEDTNVITEDGSLSVQKVGSQFNLRRNFGQLFKNSTCLIQE